MPKPREVALATKHGRSRVTLRDVARGANVHHATASRALNPQTRGMVNPGTAARIDQVARRLGYRPNPLARGLKTNRSYTIGVQVPDLTNPLFPPIIRGVQDRLEEASYTPLIANTDNDPELERNNLQTMLDRQVEGIITATATADDVALREIAATGMPLVLVNRRFEDSSISAVAVDDRRAVQLGVEHLVGLGHRRIAHIAGPQNLSTGSQRLIGFRDALLAAGIPVDEGLVRFGQAFTERAGAEACAALLDDRHDVTAVVAGNDLIALGCYDALRERGLRCPEDVSVVGFNDMRFADRFAPALSTIHVPHRALGAQAADLLLALLRDPSDPPRQVLLPTTLVVRDSTAPPR